MLGLFSDTCKMQTSAMMYKYQLEQYLTNVDLSSDLYSITAALQNVGNILETIEVRYLFTISDYLCMTIFNIQEVSSKKACIEFAPNQYEMIYTLLYNGQPLLVSLLEQVKTWIQGKDYCNKFGYPIPTSKEC